jgi:hypothetical protein
MPGKHSLTVHLDTPTGPLKYGATGFLYGLGNDGIPSLATLLPLRPQVAAQKPEGGLQHPNGDALDVSSLYRAAGGREIEIYMQDGYANWPYENLGLLDFLNKAGDMLRQAEAHPQCDLFSWVPFNEPDQIWYNTTDRKAAFLADWATMHHHIQSILPGARIVGPNLARYDSAFYRDFLTFARDYACLPDVISWHELNDDFFGGWEARYADCRAIERDLGLPPREICINEYGRIKGDLAIPGRLIQWVARFENSKVDACLAYWTDAGSLNNLVTPNHSNQVTAGWWLYRWYAELSGQTVAVTSSCRDAAGLQGLAAIDPAKKEARVLLGGADGDISVQIQGLDAIPDGNTRVRATIWEVVATGLAPSAGPQRLMAGDYTVNDGQITLTLPAARETSVYQIVLAPVVQLDDWQPGDVIAYRATPGSVPQFVFSVPQDGFYTVRLKCPGGETVFDILQIWLNGALLPAPERDENAAEFCLFLGTGIHQLNVQPLKYGRAVDVSAISLHPNGKALDCYEAAANPRTGAAIVVEDPAAPGGRFVDLVGNGPANTLEFTHVRVAHPGIYRMVVYFANAEFRGGHSYNSQVVDRWAEICVNDRFTQKIYFRNTFDWHSYQTRVVDVTLDAGDNTIRFSNPTTGAYAPHIARIAIAVPVVFL